MTLPVLIVISTMWIPLALYLLGKGEVKSTGAICGLVGLIVVVGAILQAAIFKDGFTAGLLFVHGLLYLSTAYALIVGIEDLRSVGNISLVTCIVSAIYMVLFFTGGPVLANGNQLVAKSNYFAFACAGYTVLTLEVWLFAYGKFSPKNLAGSLIAWVPFGLFIPAFWLMVAGTLPF